MNNYDLALRLIDRFGKLLGLEGLTLQGGTHSCALEFDGAIVVTFEFSEASSHMVLTTFLFEVPAAGAEPVLRLLMEANCGEYLEDGTSLGLEPQSQQVVLMQSRSVTELDDASFESLVEAFVNKAERWKSRMDDLSKTGSAEVSALAPPEASQVVSLGHPGMDPRRADGAHIFG